MGLEGVATFVLQRPFDEDAENVKLTLAFLQRHGLIEIGDDDEYQLTEVPTIIGSETASTICSRECRERKKQLALEQKALQCNTNETDCNNLKQICRVERERVRERGRERNSRPRRLWEIL